LKVTIFFRERQAHRRRTEYAAGLMSGLARLIRRPEAALFVLVLLPYAYFYQAGGWNQNSRFDLTRAIVEEGSLSIERYHRNTGDKACVDPDPRDRRCTGEHYSDKAPGASLLAVPPYAVIHTVAGSERPSRRYLDTAAYLVTVFAVGLPSALAVVALYWLLGAFGQLARRQRRRASPAPSGDGPGAGTELSPAARLAVALAYGLGTLAFPYATLFYGHQLIAALLLIGFAILVRARHGQAPPPAWHLFGAGLLLGWAVVVEYPAALAVAPITAYAALFVRPWPRLGWLVLGGLLSGLVLVAYHWAAFGGPLTLPYEFSTQQHRHLGWFMGLGSPDGEALKNILFTSYRGLFWSAPWLLLAVPGAVLLLGRAHLRAEAIVCLVVGLLFIWLNASLVDWQGGWAMGARYLIPIIPFLAILAAGCALATTERRAAARIAWAGFLALAAYSAFLMLAGTAVKPEVPTHIQRPFGQYLLPHFYAGELSISTQSIDMPNHPDGAPSMAWNWGQLLGLDGLAELIPLALLMAAAGVWLRSTASRRAA
jgi:hypothetical protein